MTLFLVSSKRSRANGDNVPQLYTYDHSLCVFDTVDWEFLDAIFNAKGFGTTWRRWICGCISSANYYVIINGGSRDKVISCRGIRQDDPLYPFLFILVSNCFSRLMAHSARLGTIAMHSVGPSSFYLNHLQFADDTLLFSTADRLALTRSFELIKIFEHGSGLRINLSKSELLGINIADSEMNWYLFKFGCKRDYWLTTYLHLLLGDNPIANSFWPLVIEKLHYRLHNWKYAFILKDEGLRSFTPLYPACRFIIYLYMMPTKTIKQMDKITWNFLWEGPRGNGGLHNVNW